MPEGFLVQSPGREAPHGWLHGCTCSGRYWKIRSMAMQQDPIDWRYLPYILGLFSRPKFQGISPENMARNIVLTYLHFRILKISH